MANLFGTGINQVPTNGMLGSLAFQDKAYVAVDAIGIGTTFVDSGTASQPLQVAGGGYFSGSVGIGTTNPGAKLDVYGTSRFGGTTSTGRRVDITTEGIVTLASGNNANSSNLILQNASDTGATTNHGNSILWQFGTSTTTAPINAGEVKIAKELQWTTTATTQDAYFSISLALDGTVGEKLRVTSSGNLGIGTTNPAYPLDIYSSATSNILRVRSQYGTAETIIGDNFIKFFYVGGSTIDFATSLQFRDSSFNPILYLHNSTKNVLVGTSTATGTASQPLQVAGGGYFSGNVGIGTTNPSSQLHITGQFQSTRANSATTGGGQIYLNGANGNRIDFSTAGVAAPAFTTRSAGTKLVLYPSVGASLVDYALGIETATLWSSVPDSSYRFKWYAGTTNIASLFGTGELVLGTTSLTGTTSQPLQVTGGAYVSGSVGIGTTNPTSTLQVSGTFYNSGIGTFANGDTTYGTTSASSLELGLNNNSNAGTLKLWGTTTNAYGLIQATTSNLHIDCVVGAVYLNYYDGNFVSFGTGAGAESARFTGSTGTLTLGSITSTGTASQPLQVTGGAYVSGNVGIGTTDPTSKLAVSGFITENSGDGTFWNVVTQKDVGYSANQVPLNQYLGQLAFLDAYSPAGLRRTGGGSDDVVVSSTGLVGIGTASPTTTLDVVGSIKGAVTSGTVQASTAGTAINFTGIPSWVKRITVGFNAVKTSGTSPPLIQIGSSALGYTSTGYTGSNSVISNASAVTANFTNGIGLGVNTSNWSSSQVVSGTVTFVLVDSANNTWSASGIVGSSNATVTWWTAGAKSLATSNTLDRIRVTTSGGTETFAGGSINILYEG